MAGGINMSTQNGQASSSTTTRSRVAVQRQLLSLLAMLVMMVASPSVSIQACPEPPILSEICGPADGWTRPNAPTGFTAARDVADPTHKINLGWSDNSDHETGYMLEWSLTSDFAVCSSASLDANANSYVHAGLEAGKHYYYRLKALTPGSCSTTVLADVGTLAESPVISEVNSDSSSSINIYWNQVSGATNYGLYRSTSRYGDYRLIAANISGQTYQNTGLYSGTTYWFKVAANNADGTSSLSIEASGLTRLVAPAISKIDAVSSCSLVINWNTSTGATGYKLLRSTDGTNFNPYGNTVTTNCYNDTGLDADSVYSYKVIAVNTGGDSVASAALSGRTLTNRPIINSVVSASNGALQVAWGSVAGATSYKIYRLVDSSFVQLGDAQTGTNFEDNALTAGLHCWYKIKAVNAAGDSAASTPKGNWTRPEAPVISTDLLTSNSVGVEWNPVVSAKTYSVYRAPSQNGTYTQLDNHVTSNTHYFSETGLSLNSEYWYKVLAVNDGGESSLSEAAVCATATVAPTLLGVETPSANSLRPIWSSVTNATGYKLLRRDAVNTTYTQQGGVIDDLYYVDSDLPAGTQFWYELVAVIGGVDSDPSAPCTAWTKPAVPTIGTVEAVYNRANRVSWSAETGAEGYYIYRSTVENGQYDKVGLSATAPFTDTSITTGGLCYYYKVSAFNSGGESALSAAASCTARPDAPRMTSVDSISSDSLRVNWSTIPSATGYLIYRSTNEAGLYELRDNVTLTSFTDDTITTPATCFWYKVAATTAVGDTSPSLPMYNVTRPDSPRIATAATLSESAITISWNPVGGATQGYNIIRYSAADGTKTLQQNYCSLEFKDETCDEASQYAYSVVAVGEGGVSGASTPIIRVSAPAVPTGIHVTANETTPTRQLDISWLDNSGGEANYVIERSPNGHDSWAVTTIGSSTGSGRTLVYSDTSVLSEGTCLWYRVRAKVFDNGTALYSADSAPVTGWTRPEPPTNFSADYGVNGVMNLSWTDNSSRESGYILERSVAGSNTWSQVVVTAADVTAATDTLVTAATSYTYRIRAFISGGAESRSIEIPAMVQTSPAPPAAVSVTYVSATSCNVEWSPVSGASQYKLYRSIDGSAYTLISTQSALTYLDQNLSLGAAVSYQVAAVVGDVDSSASNPVSNNVMVFRINDSSTNKIWEVDSQGYMSRISGVTAGVSTQDLNAISDKIWVLRDASGNPVAVLTHSSATEGELKIHGQIFNISTALQESCVLLWDLKDSTGNCLVKIDSGGNLYTSSNLNLTLYANNTETPKRIDLSWAPGTGPSQVVVERSKDLPNAYAAIATVSTSAQAYVDQDTNLIAGTCYYYRLRYGNPGQEQYTNEPNSWTFPDPPTQVDALPGGTQISVTWSGVNSDYRLRYNVLRSLNADSGFKTIASKINGCSYTDLGLAANTTYYYKIQTIIPTATHNTSADSAVAQAKTTISKPGLNLSASPNETNVMLCVGEEATPITISPTATQLDYEIGTEVKIVADPEDSLHKRFAYWMLDGKNMGAARTLVVKLNEYSTYNAEAVYEKFFVNELDPVIKEHIGLDCHPSVRFNQTLPAGFSNDYMTVHGSLSGRIERQDVLNNYDWLEFRPAPRVPHIFQLGEQVSVTVKKDLPSSIPGENLVRPYVWSFTTKPIEATPRVVDMATFGGSMSIESGAGGDSGYRTVTAMAAVSLLNDENNPNPQVVVGYQDDVAGLIVPQKDGTPEFMTLDEYVGLTGEYSADKKTSAIAVGDLNKFDDTYLGAGLTDIVVGNNPGRTHVYISGKTEAGLYTVLNRIDLGNATDEVRAIAIGDLDGDGCNDIVAVGDMGESHSNIVIYWNQEKSLPFTESNMPFSDLHTTAFGVGGRVRALALADINKDGALDIIVGNCGGRIDKLGPNVVYLNNNTATGRAEAFNAAGCANETLVFGSETDLTTSFAVADFNEDSRADVAVGTWGGPVVVYLNDEEKPFARTMLVLSETDETESDQVNSLAAADLNGDGYMDLVVGHEGDVANPIYLNSLDSQGTRILSKKSYTSAIYQVATNTRALAIADFDGDSKLDVAMDNLGMPSTVRQQIPAENHFFSMDSRMSYVYDWAVDKPEGYSWRSNQLLFPDGDSNMSHEVLSGEVNFTANSPGTSASDITPAVCTDGQGHWVVAWSTTNPLNYCDPLILDYDPLDPYTQPDSDPFLISFNPEIEYTDFNRDIDLDNGNDNDIVVSRFWDMRKTEANGFDTTQDSWAGLIMDQDTLWSPPVPYNAADAASDRHYPADNDNDIAPSIATDGHGNWAMVWVRRYDFGGYDTTSQPPHNTIFPDPNNPRHQVSRKVMLSVWSENDDGMNWSRAVEVSDLHMESYLGGAGEAVGGSHIDYVKPKIVCAPATNGSKWLIVYPACDPRVEYHNNEIAPPMGSHRAFDTDLYVSEVNTQLNPTSGKYEWVTEDNQVKIEDRRCLNSNTANIQVPASEVSTQFLYGYDATHGYPTGATIDDPYDGCGSFHAGTGDRCYDPYSTGYATDCPTTADDGIKKGSIEFGCNPLDMATDGEGNWVVVWQSYALAVDRRVGAVNQKVRLRTNCAYPYDYNEAVILFAYSSNNGDTWSAPFYVANSQNIESRASDDNPTVRYGGDGKWIVFWDTHDPVSGIMGYNGEIAYSVVHTNQLAEGLAGTAYYADTPWSEVQFLNSDAYTSSFSDIDAINSAPKAATSGKGDWVVTWSKYVDWSYKYGERNVPARKKVTQYAYSIDNGETWHDAQNNIIYSKDLPFQRANFDQVITADSTSNYLIAWVTQGINGEISAVPDTLLDSDIMAARTAGLLAEHTLMPSDPAFELTPTPTPVPTPDPVVVDYNDVSSADMQPAYITGNAEFPLASSDLSRPYTLAEDDPFSQDIIAAIKDPAGTSWNMDYPAIEMPQGRVAYFHMPVSGALAENETISQLKLNLAGKSLGRCQISFWVFKARDFGPQDWQNPEAWELVGRADDWPKLINGDYDLSIILDRNFGQYLTTVADGTESGEQFAGKTKRSAGTLTWAVSIQAKTAQAQEFQIDYAKIDVLKRYQPAAAAQVSDKLQKTTTGVVFYARIKNAYPPILRDMCGDVRLVLSTPPAPQTSSDFSLGYEVIGVDKPIKNTKLRLVGFGPDPLNPTNYDQEIFGHDLASFDSTGQMSYADESQSWSYNDPTSIPEFERTLLEGHAAIELIITYKGVDKRVCRYPVSPDKDDDGLTSLEEDLPASGDMRPDYNRDRDSDGLLDGEEKLCLGLAANSANGCDPTKVDSDSDGLADSLECGMTAAILSTRQLETPYSKTVRFTSGAEALTFEITGMTAPQTGTTIHAEGYQLVDADHNTWTDPGKADTDGDGFFDGPNAWTTGYMSMLHAGEDNNGDGQYDADGIDGTIGTEDDEYDPNDYSSKPAGDHCILAIDSDSDGLSDQLESEAGTYPDDADSDNDGLKDGDEVWGFINARGEVDHLPLTSQWARRPTDPLKPDSDGDGLPDGLEMGMTVTGESYSNPGENDYNTKWYADTYNVNDDWIMGNTSEEDILKYIPENYKPGGNYIKKDTFVAVPQGAIINVTDPWCIDSDHDGTLDYNEDKDQDGVYEPTQSETDPSRGLVNLPPPRGWNSYVHYTDLRMGFWRSLTDEGHVFLGLTGITLGQTDFSVFGKFGINFGNNDSDLELSVVGGNPVLSKSGRLRKSETEGANWLAIDLLMEGSQTAEMFKLNLNDSQDNSDLATDVQGAFDQNMIDSLIPPDACFVVEVDDFVSWLDFLSGVGDLVIDEVKEELFFTAVAVTCGGTVASLVSGGLTIIGGVYIMYELVTNPGVVNWLHSAEVGPHWMNAIIQNGWPIGIKVPDGIGPLSGGLASAIGPIRPFFYRTLHNLTVQENHIAAYPKPREYTLHTVNDLSFITGNSTGVPLSRITLVYSENFLTRTFLLAEAACGRYGDGVENPMYVPPMGECVTLGMDPQTPSQTYYIPQHAGLGANAYKTEPAVSYRDKDLSLAEPLDLADGDGFERPALDTSNPTVAPEIYEINGPEFDIDVWGAGYSKESKTGNALPWEKLKRGEKLGVRRPPQGTLTYDAAVIFGFIAYGPEQKELLMYDPDGMAEPITQTREQLKALKPEERAEFLRKRYQHSANRNLIDSMLKYTEQFDLPDDLEARKTKVTDLQHKLTISDINSKLGSESCWAGFKEEYKAGAYEVQIEVDSDAVDKPRARNTDGEVDVKHGGDWLDYIQKEASDLGADKNDKSFMKKVYQFKVRGRSMLDIFKFTRRHG